MKKRKKAAWNNSKQNSNEKLSKKTEEEFGNQRNQGSHADLKSKRRIKHSREKKIKKERKKFVLDAKKNKK